jgi:hypothetical protein
MEVLDSKSQAILSFFNGMDEMLTLIGQVLKDHTPHLNGEKFLTGKDVCRILNISMRTLQEWRSNRIMPFIRVKSKILYRQRDVEKVLAENGVASVPLPASAFDGRGKGNG